MKETHPSPQAQQKTQSKSELLLQIATLEATVARLETTIEKQKTGEATPRQGAVVQFFRRLAIWLLVILCALSFTLSASALWIKRTVVNTDVWVEKTSQLLDDQTIRSQISSSILGASTPTVRSWDVCPSLRLLAASYCLALS